MLCHKSASKVLFVLAVLVGSSSIVQTHLWTNSDEAGQQQHLLQNRHNELIMRGAKAAEYHHHQPAPPKNDNIKRAIFYNIFVPNGENRTKAIDIVKEQLTMRNELSSVLLDASVPIHYTLIGNDENENSTTTKEIQRGCGSNCHQIQYSREGDESLTLQSLYEYCADHPDVQVTYLHNKGSYHPSERNENFRHMLTKAVFSDECQIDMNRVNEYTQILGEEEKQPSENRNGQCNICGARFSSFPHYHMAGNMWTSQCSYIRQLIPPNQFVQRMDEMFDYAFMNSNPEVIPQPTFQQIQGEYAVGRQRYAYEHWVTSHPNLQPCDVYPGRYTHGYRDLPTSKSHWRPSLSKSPRWSMSQFLKISMNRGQWFCGQARLFEFYYLYKKQPAKENWFGWDYYKKPYKGCDIPLDKERDLITDTSTIATLLSNHRHTGSKTVETKLTTNVPAQIHILKNEGEY